jgi:hypothetical protein
MLVINSRPDPRSAALHAPIEEIKGGVFRL